MKEIRNSVWVLAILVMLGGIVSPNIPNASAFVPGPTGPTGSLWAYRVDPTFTAEGYLLTSLHTAEQVWKVHELTSRGQYWDNGTGTRVVYASTAPHPAEAALSTVSCNTTCSMTFNVNYGYWNTTDEHRVGQLDFIGIAVHEFGHWLGLQHSCAGTEVGGANPICVREDAVASDPGSAAPSDPGKGADTMYAFFAAGEEWQRTITQNDANGFLWVRNDTSHAGVLADHGFETFNTANFNGWGLLPPTIYDYGVSVCGSATSVNAQEGSCIFNMSGNSNSTYQDVEVVRGVGAARSGFSGSIRFRPGAPSTTSTVVLALWDLTGIYNNVSSGCTTTRPASTSPWATCTLPQDLTGGLNVIYYQRYQLYNITPPSVDLDRADLNRQ